ncbi:MAG: exoribonuclease R [Acidimicrobiales bacterium]|jgi:exoribonuclease R
MAPFQIAGQTFTDELEAGFAEIRRELDVPPFFPPAVVAEAELVAQRGPLVPPGAATGFVDRTDLPLLTIDPPGSIDLDQAFAAERSGDGYRVWYAIADVASFVAPDSALDAEARIRGVTLYSPDQRASLHPDALNESAGSLLPGTTKPAVLWQINLDADGHQTAAHAHRAMVHSREKLTYRQAQDRIDAGDDNVSLELLREIGKLRQQIETDRGAISLQLPSQEISTNSDGDYILHYDTSLPVEGWNAQISLLTGMAAGQIMVDAGHGLLRTLPPLHKGTIKQVRQAAQALDVDWPEAMSYPDRVRELDPNNPREAALLVRAARSFRGAGYEAFFDHQVPEQPLHGAIAAIYAHVTAPLRRVCDRFANEIVLAHCGGIDTPTWALEALEELPAIMTSARQRDGALERASVDFVETIALRCRIGETFDGTVLSHSRSGAKVLLRDPAVLAPIREQPEIGEVVRLHLDSVDSKKRRVEFSIVG